MENYIRVILRSKNHSISIRADLNDKSAMAALVHAIKLEPGIATDDCKEMRDFSCSIEHAAKYARAAIKAGFVPANMASWSMFKLLFKNQ